MLEQTEGFLMEGGVSSNTKYYKWLEELQVHKAHYLP
jgi:hypothetical protein